MTNGKAPGAAGPETQEQTPTPRAQRLTAPVDPVARGRLFEQWVVLECLRLVDYLDLEARCYIGEPIRVPKSIS